MDTFYSSEIILFYMKTIFFIFFPVEKNETQIYIQPVKYHKKSTLRGEAFI